MNITILSDGAWGTALGCVLCNNNHKVVQWGPFPEYLATIAKERVNSKFLPGVKLPDSLIIEPDMEKAVKDADIVLLATPTQYLRSVLENFLPYFDSDKHIIVNVAKGIEQNTLLRVSQITESVIGKSKYVVLSGPSHAEEVSRNIPTLVVAASSNKEAALVVQQTFSNSHFRVYTSSDVIGVELGGALKNVMALAAGIADGMKLGDNPKAALLTRGIAEMGRLGEALGGSSRTFSGLSGVGDLIVTCTSGHSRNRYVGEELGRGRKLNDIIASMGMMVAEGVTTASGAAQLAKNANVETPIIDEICAILFYNKSPETAILDLMTRGYKEE